MADEQHTEHLSVPITGTMDCLFCLGTGREPLTLGLMRCKHCKGTGKRTFKRTVTVVIDDAWLDSLFDEDEDEPADTQEGGA